MRAYVSAVAPIGDGFRLSIRVDKDRQMFDFPNKEDCTKARVEAIKRFKDDGFKVFT